MPRSLPAGYIPRSLERTLRRAAREFPVVVLTGPRQSGKTTLLKHVFGPRHRYVSLEPPDTRAVAAADPRGFLELHRPPVILDEIQYAPDLLPYVKEVVDAHRSRPGQYLLTGSQNLGMAAAVTESLAGRAAVLRLLPLSWREMAREPARPLPWERTGSRSEPVRRGRIAPGWPAFLRGTYPELVAHPRRDAELWHASYVQTYLERDVRSIRQVGDLVEFQRFLRAVAARSAQLLDLSDIARDLGVAVNTARAWLSVLEATYQVFLLRPYYANLGKRLVKTPKVYMADVGLLCYLTGIRTARQASEGPLAGAIFETAVVAEVVRTLIHRGREPLVHFWRTSAGSEVDLLVEEGARLVPIEVKATATPRPPMAAGIAAFRRDLGARADRGYLVHGGDAELPLGTDATAWPISRL
jgi:predicted AAA+ superfamily ATPase